MERKLSSQSAKLSCSPDNVIGLYSSFLNNKGMLKRKFPSNGSLSKVSLAIEKESLNNFHTDGTSFALKADITLSECKSLVFKYNKLLETKEIELEEIKKERQLYVAENEKIIKQYYELEQVVKNNQESSKIKTNDIKDFCNTEKKSQVEESPIRSFSLRKNSYQTEEERIYELEQENSKLLFQLEVSNKEKNNLETENNKVISKLHIKIANLQKDVDESHEKVAELKETKETIEKKFRLSQVSKVRKSNKRKAFEESKFDPPVPSPGSSLISMQNCRKLSVISDNSDSGSDCSSSSIQLRKKIEKLTHYNQYLEIQTCEAEKKLYELEKKIQNKDQSSQVKKKDLLDQPVPVALNSLEIPTPNGSKRGRFFSSLDSFRSSIASVSSVFNAGSSKHLPDPLIVSSDNMNDIPTFSKELFYNNPDISNLRDESNLFVEPEKRKEIVQWIQSQPDLCLFEDASTCLDTGAKQDENKCSLIDNTLLKLPIPNIEAISSSYFYNPNENHHSLQPDRNVFKHRSDSLQQNILDVDNNHLSLDSENSCRGTDENIMKHLLLSKNYALGSSQFTKSNLTSSPNISNEELITQHKKSILSSHFQANSINRDPVIYLNSNNGDNSSLMDNDNDFKNTSSIYKASPELPPSLNQNKENKPKVSFNQLPITTADSSRRIDLSNIVHPSISKYIKQFNGQIISNNNPLNLSNNFRSVIPESPKRLFKHIAETSKNFSGLNNKTSNSSIISQLSPSQKDVEITSDKKECLPNLVYSNIINNHKNNTRIISPDSLMINETLSTLDTSCSTNKKLNFNDDDNVKKTNHQTILEQTSEKILASSIDFSEKYSTPFQKITPNADYPSIDTNITDSINSVSLKPLSMDQNKIFNLNNLSDNNNGQNKKEKFNPKDNKFNSKKRIPLNFDSFTHPSLNNSESYLFSLKSPNQTPTQSYIQPVGQYHDTEAEYQLNKPSQMSSVVQNPSFQKPSEVLFSYPNNSSYPQNNENNELDITHNHSYKTSETSNNLQTQPTKANSPPIHMASASNLTRKIEACRETHTLNSNFSLNHSVHDQVTSDSDESSYSFARPKLSSISSSSFDPSDTRNFSSLRSDFNSENYPPIGSRERFFYSQNQKLVTNFNNISNVIRTPNSLMNPSQMSISSVTTAIQSYCLSNPSAYPNFPQHLPNYNNFEYLKHNFNIHLRRREPFGITSIIRYCIFSFFQWIQFLVLLVLAIFIALIRGPHRHFQDSDNI